MLGPTALQSGSFNRPGYLRLDFAWSAQLSRQLEDIALRWGCTTVVDTGSDLANTLALRDRVAPGMDADLVLLGAARLLASERILRAGLAGYRPSPGAVVLPHAGGQIEIG